MKVLVGVDLAGVYKPALDLVLELGLPHMKLILANSVDASALGPLYNSGVYPLLDLDYDNYVTEIGKQALDHAADRACARNRMAETVSLLGNPALGLMQLADERKVDVIAVQSERKTAFESLFMGSVCRALAIGAHQSVLISKLKEVPSGSMSAVFATDHSNYAESAFKEFLHFAPAGIKSVHVVSAIDLTDAQDYLRMAEDAGLENDTEKRGATDFHEKNLLMVEKLKELGYEASSSVIPGAAHAAIDEAMSVHKAHLLIMGAQGHGFMHRLFIGSTSLHQVLKGPHSVLLLRPAPAQMVQEEKK